jgi:DNA-binding NtrC family response regulator
MRAQFSLEFRLKLLEYERTWRNPHSQANMLFHEMKAVIVAVVLVVEDDEQVRVLAESILQGEGHTVLAATGVEGSTALLQSDQPIDVLFIDLNLGSEVEVGLAVAQAAKEKRSQLAVLYTTGSGINDGMKAMFAEPCLFLPKPYTAEQLTKSVAFLMLKPRPREALAV